MKEFPLASTKEFDITLTENEMSCIADICKKYFDACKIGRVRPGELRVVLLSRVLTKFQNALLPKEGEPDGNRLQVVQSGDAEPDAC